MEADTDVLVIGGGIVGVCSAYFLAEQGLQVSVVEQGDLASGCSGGNAGLIVPSHIIPLAAPGVLIQGLRWMLNSKSPFYIKPWLNSALFDWLWKFGIACRSKQMLKGLHVLHDLTYASLELYKHMIMRESLNCNYQEDGWLLVYKTNKHFQKAIAEAQLLKSYGVEMKIMKADEALEMESVLLPEISGGIFFPEDAHMDPARFVQSLAGSLQEKGVAIHQQTEVVDFKIINGRISLVRTTCGDIKPKFVVLAAGVWSSVLGKKSGLKLPLQPGKGYSISIKKSKAFTRVPLYLSEAKVAVTPLEDVLRFAGTLELAGMDFTINHHRVRAIMHAVEDYMGKIENLDSGEIWSGLRPCTPDGLPILDRISGFNNLILATGHCMLGITLAPITGKLISQLICEQSSDVNLAPLSLNRFK